MPLNSSSPAAPASPSPIPLLDLRAQLASYRTEALAAIERVVDAQEMIMGPEVGAFERALATYAGVGHALGMSSGTDALLAALMALDVGPGDEVVTTTFSFFATAGVIARLGARPVFTDIDPATFNATPEALRAAVTPRTKAVIPVHLFGQMADVATLSTTPGLPPVIEDSAQSLGARLDGRMTGQYGAMTCVSFFPSKNLGGFGDGGATLTNDPVLAEKLAILRVHGSKPKYFHHVVGGNFRLDTLQAAVLAVKLPHLDTWADARRRNAARYDALFVESGLVSRGLVVTPPTSARAHHVYNQYVIRVPDRDALARALGERGIGTAVYYPRPLHLQPCFAGLGYGPGDFPEAERACAEVLALPVYPELPSGALERVVSEIGRFYGL